VTLFRFLSSALPGCAGMSTDPSLALSILASVPHVMGSYCALKGDRFVASAISPRWVSLLLLLGRAVCGSIPMTGNESFLHGSPVVDM